IVAAAPLVAELLASCPQLKVLVTSRAVLRISGEFDVPVPPLEVPDPIAPETTLRESDSIRLFIERAHAATGSFAPDAEQLRTVAAICARLDGLPLAIELAAAKLRLLSPDALLARLSPRLPLLSGGPRDAPERLRTMR